MTTPTSFYHDFRLLGLDLPQAPGIFAQNQKAKEPVILGYLMFAIGKLKARGITPLTFTELFCADAYYAFFARNFGADRAYGFDNNRDGYLDQAFRVQEIIGDEGVELHQLDIFDIPKDFRSSIVANIGGLYHTADPLRALEFSYEMCRNYLIVQSVVTLATEDEDYFETPAPGWAWGCRFSYAWLRRQIIQLGYRIIDTERNQLPGNGRPEDCGSAYFLISKS